MRIFNNLFYLLFRVLKSFEAGFTHQTDSNRSFEVIMVISIFEMLNLMSIFPLWNGRVLFVPYIVLFVINVVVFHKSGRYKKIVENFQSVPHSPTLNAIVIAYLCLTVIVFIVTRSW
jgi:hypothetical protein